MFGLGLPEILLILVVFLIFVGPARLPDVAKGLGKGLRELRKASRELDDVEEIRALRQTVAELREPLSAAWDEAGREPAGGAKAKSEPAAARPAETAVDKSGDAAK